MAKGQSEFDKAVDILLARQKDTTNELIRRFKNTRPFRQVPVSRKEMILNFDDMMSREGKLREDFGNEAVDNYKQNVLKQLGSKGG